jgi:hypothetical protein
MGGPDDANLTGCCKCAGGRNPMNLSILEDAPTAVLSQSALGCAYSITQHTSRAAEALPFCFDCLRSR